MEEENKPSVSFIIEDPSLFMNRRSVRTNHTLSNNLTSNTFVNPIILDEGEQTNETSTSLSYPHHANLKASDHQRVLFN